ncbi:cdc42 effector protein 2-like [Discoglossus pictus]
MPAKAPIYLKTSTPKRGKKPKLRDVLSREMISPPLGDFRHSAHIGLDGEGDMFGELSFLQGKYDLLPNLSRKFTIQSADASLDEEFHAHASNVGYRPYLKSAVSLPVFCGTQDKERAPPKPPRLHLEETSSHRSMSISYGEGCFHRDEGLSFSSISHDDRSRFLAASVSSSEDSLTDNGAFSPAHGSNSTQNNKSNQEQSFPKSESLFGMELDLGPSILDDILRIMDDYKL